MTVQTPIYLDYQATTPTDPRVVEAMAPYWTKIPGNDASSSHKFGWDAQAAVATARKQIADAIGADSREIVFTSGATESNNTAIKGLASFMKGRGNHIITTQIEHKCVLDTCRHLEQEGYEITYLPVDEKGLIRMADLEAAITDQTILVSIMHGNNEIGVVQDVTAIGKLCREKGVKFHSDCAQSFGKLPIDVEEMNIDMLSLSAHKVYGPMGVGAMYVRRKPRVRLHSLIHGGGQERGMRSGTLPVPLIVGFGKAAELAVDEMDSESARLTYLRDKMITAIQGEIDEVYLNGDAVKRLPGNVNLSFSYVEGESLMMAIGDLAVSSGSACTSASLEPSYVLRALGVSEELAHTSIRMGIGRFTTEEEVDYAIQLICSKVQNLREMSPLWEMVQEGVDLSTVKWAEH